MKEELLVDNKVDILKCDDYDQSENKIKEVSARRRSKWHAPPPS